MKLEKLFTTHEAFEIGVKLEGVGAVPGKPVKGICHTIDSLHMNLTDSCKRHDSPNLFFTFSPS